MFSGPETLILWATGAEKYLPDLELFFVRASGLIEVPGPWLVVARITGPWSRYEFGCMTRHTAKRTAKHVKTHGEASSEAHGKARARTSTLRVLLLFWGVIFQFRKMTP